MADYPTIAVSPVDDFSDWKQIVLGVVEGELFDPEKWDDYDTVEPLLHDLLYFLAELPTVPALTGVQFSTHLTMFEFWNVVGNPPIWVDAACFMGGFSYQDPPAVDDDLTWKARVLSGSNLITLIYTADSDCGQVDIYIDGVLRSAAFNTYSATTQHTQRRFYPYTASADKEIDIRLHTTGQDASSTDCKIKVQAISVTRTQ